MHTPVRFRDDYGASGQVLLHDKDEVPWMLTNGFKISAGATTQVVVDAEYVSKVVRNMFVLYVWCRLFCYTRGVVQLIRKIIELSGLSRTS
jgi:hypothetical protein